MFLGLRHLAAVGAAGLMFFVAGQRSASGATLAPNGFIVFTAADATSVSALEGSSSLAATIGGTYTTGGGETGSYKENVYLTSGGTYDFWYTFNETAGLSGITQMALIDYSGFTTNVFYDQGDGAFGTGLPAEVDRSAAPGQTIDSVYNHGTSITAGNGAAWIVVQTNATYYTLGNTDIGFQDGTGTNWPGYGPATAPLPATASTGLSLFAGLGALVGLRKLTGRRSVA